MSNLINVPSNIILPETSINDDHEAIFDKFETQLANYCKTNSTCKDAGKSLVFYHDENSDSNHVYGAEYMIFDYDNLIHVPTWYAYKSNDETLSPLNESSIIKLLKEQDMRYKALDKGNTPF